MRTGKTIILAIAGVVGFTDASWGFGLTLGQNPYTEGPYYSNNSPGLDTHCKWQRKWVTDKSGRRALRRVRICH